MQLLRREEYFVSFVESAERSSKCYTHRLETIGLFGTLNDDDVSYKTAALSSGNLKTLFSA